MQLPGESQALHILSPSTNAQTSRHDDSTAAKMLRHDNVVTLSVWLRFISLIAVAKTFADLY
jgi:hypothetical protein